MMGKETIEDWIKALPEGALKWRKWTEAPRPTVTTPIVTRDETGFAAQQYYAAPIGEMAPWLRGPSLEWLPITEVFAAIEAQALERAARAAQSVAVEAQTKEPSARAERTRFNSDGKAPDWYGGAVEAADEATNRIRALITTTPELHPSPTRSPEDAEVMALLRRAANKILEDELETPCLSLGCSEAGTEHNGLCWACNGHRLGFEVRDTPRGRLVCKQDRRPVERARIPSGVLVPRRRVDGRYRLPGRGGIQGYEKACEWVEGLGYVSPQHDGQRWTCLRPKMDLVPEDPNTEDSRQIKALGVCPEAKPEGGYGPGYFAEVYISQVDREGPALNERQRWRVKDCAEHSYREGFKQGFAKRVEATKKIREIEAKADTSAIPAREGSEEDSAIFDVQEQHIRIGIRGADGSYRELARVHVCHDETLTIDDAPPEPGYVWKTQKDDRVPDLGTWDPSAGGTWPAHRYMQGGFGCDGVWRNHGSPRLDVGQSPKANFAADVEAAILKRWPETKTVEIMGNGGKWQRRMRINPPPPDAELADLLREHSHPFIIWTVEYSDPGPRSY